MIRSLTHKVRTRRANRQLGGLLAFVAGAANAGGFLAIQRYTSHMTGIVTDLGIELGRLFYWNRTHAGNLVHFVEADRDKVPLALALVLSAVAAPPLWQDLGDWLRQQDGART